MLAVDLTNRLPSSPAFHDPLEWTTQKLRAQLDEWDIKYEWQDGRAKPPACLFCNETEGNPCFGVTDGNVWYRCHRANKCDKRWSDVQSLFARLPTMSLAELPARHPKPRATVIDGLLRRGDVMNFVGPPKARKSFAILQMVISVAVGIPFIGRSTTPGQVLLIDNELKPDDLGRRAKAIAAALGVSLPSNVQVMNLRGKLADLNSIRAELSHRRESYSLIAIDALYKAMPRDSDENSNSDVTQAYLVLDAIAEEQDSATVVVHHTSKGTQAHKSVSDMGAGAGAQSRSADVHLVAREHEDEDTIVLQAVLRSLPPIDAVCLKFNYPIWEVTDANPQNVAVAGKKPAATVDEFVATIPVTPASKSEVLAASKMTLGVSHESIKALLRAALDRQLVAVTVPTARAQPHLISRVTP